MCLANVVEWCRSKFDGVDIIPVSASTESTIPVLMNPLRNYLKELLRSSETDAEAARVADDMVLTWKKVGFNGWEIENKESITQYSCNFFCVENLE